MCGRFSLFFNPFEVRVRFNVERWHIEYNPRFNISPGQDIITIMHDDGIVAADTLRWGLIPSWSKEGARGAINARSESIDEKPYFKGAFRAGQRCIIPADGFYEWAKTDDGRQPYYFRMNDGGVFGFAGLYDTCKDQTSVAIITCRPNRLVDAVHDRMPVILEQGVEMDWLDPGSDSRDLKRMLKPYDAGLMESYPVGKDVNDTVNDCRELIKPFNAPIGRQRTLGDY